jgi:broad specificity phosphatase PhoE
MDVYFIRHGHALHNARFEAIGEAAYASVEHAYSHLTEKGHIQTLTVCVPHVDAVYCSPLVRCIQSARNIFGDKMLHLYDGLIETQGEHPCNVRESTDVIQSKYGAVSTIQLKGNGLNVVETPAMVKERAEQTLTSILHTAWIHNYNSIAIVTHHDWLQELLGKSLTNAEVYRTHYSVTELRERFY